MGVVLDAIAVCSGVIVAVVVNACVAFVTIVLSVVAVFKVDDDWIAVVVAAWVTVVFIEAEEEMERAEAARVELETKVVLVFVDTSSIELVTVEALEFVL